MIFLLCEQLKNDVGIEAVRSKSNPRGVLGASLSSAFFQDSPPVPPPPPYGNHEILEPDDESDLDPEQVSE